MSHVCCEVCGGSAIKKAGEDRFQCQSCGVEYSKAELRLLLSAEKESGEPDTEPTVPPQETAIHIHTNEETQEPEPPAPKYDVAPPRTRIVQHREWEAVCATLSADDLYTRMMSPEEWSDTHRMVCYQELLRRDLVREPDDSIFDQLCSL